jgi:hypothetical protein
MKGLGWVKMRGKKCKVLNCGCCVAENFRDEILWKEASNEIRFENLDLYPTEGEYAYMSDMDRRSAADEGVDNMTLAKYTWGVGMSEPRIEAIMAQRRADYLKRFADIYDAMHDGRDIEEILRAA